MTESVARFDRYTVYLGDNLRVAARRTASRIVFEDFPDIWQTSNGDFNTIYDLEEKFERGHRIGQMLVQLDRIRSDGEA